MGTAANESSDKFGATGVFIVGNVVLFVVVAISGFGSSNRPASPKTDRSARAATSNDHASKTDAALGELKAIEREANRRLSQGHTDAPDLHARRSSGGLRARQSQCNEPPTVPARIFIEHAKTGGYNGEQRKGTQLIISLAFRVNEVCVPGLVELRIG
jgi:hypothetical protein